MNSHIPSKYTPIMNAACTRCQGTNQLPDITRDSDSQDYDDSSPH